MQDTLGSHYANSHQHFNLEQLNHIPPGTSALVTPSQTPQDMSFTNCHGFPATIAGLEALTLEFEALAAGQGASAIPSLPAQSPFPAFDDRLLYRLDGVADDIFALSSRLQATGTAMQNHVCGTAALPAQVDVPSVKPPAPQSFPRSALLSRSTKNIRRHTSPLPKAFAQRVDFVADISASLCAATSALPQMVPGGTWRGRQMHQDEAVLTPGGSARGNRQVHQGMAAKQTGCSRESSSKAAQWRTQRQPVMTILPDKVPKLTGEPSSPKFQKPKKVWLGSKGSSRSLSPDVSDSLENAADTLVRRKSMCDARSDALHQDRSAAAIKARIDKKLTRLFGKSAKATKYNTAPTSCNSCDDEEDDASVELS
jgi:hypothetical protein